MTQTYEDIIREMGAIDDEIYALQQPIIAKLADLNKKKSDLKADLDNQIMKEASEFLKDKDYGCGTANIETPQFKIKAVVSKKIKWDEEHLAKIERTIREAGKNPRDFIKQKLSVSETAYKGFPVDIQEVFEPARSVEPSAPKITIERK